MRILLFQLDVKWASPSVNRAHIESALSVQPSCDLVVLPEMFTTGFGAASAAIAEPAENSETLAWMQSLAGAHDCAVAGTVAVRDGASLRNRFYFVKPDGSFAFYDKHHLFVLGGEDVYTAGTTRRIVEWRGARFILFICYDLRFPIWCRNREDYDVALFSANWPTARIGQWSALLRARAIENQCYVVGVNRVGTDPACDYSGQSAAIHPFGHELASCGNAEALVMADLDLERLQHLRERFPVLKDQDR